MALNTVSSERLSTNVKTSNLGTELKKKVGQNKNLILNGAFLISQRGTSSTSNGYQTVDRWNHNAGGTGVTVTFSQQSTTSSDTPYQNGFSNFFRIALSGAGTANANAYAEVLTKLEAQDIANSGWNFKSSSSNITLSFWVRPSTNQTFYGFLRSYDGSSYVYAFSFTASGNNTWTKITKTIPGNSNLDFAYDTGTGLQLMVTPFYGTDYTNNRTLDTWATLDTANYFPDMASTWLTAGASTFDLTGFQLETGSVATDFEHECYQKQLYRCYRYYVQRGFTTLMGSVSGSVGFPRINYPVVMRAAPSTYINYDNTNGAMRNQNDGSKLTGVSTYNHYDYGFAARGAGSGNTIYSSTYYADAEL